MNGYKSFYVRPCLEFDGETISYKEHDEFYSKMSELQERRHNDASFEFKSFWTVYGVNQDGTSDAISDLISEQAANQLMQSIVNHEANNNKRETTEACWDCDCSLHYIHPKTSSGCKQCGADYTENPHDYPDSILEELKEPCNIAFVQKIIPSKETFDLGFQPKQSKKTYEVENPDCFCNSEDAEHRDLHVHDARDNETPVFPDGKPWFVVTANNMATFFESEEEACKFQRHWRELMQLDAMTGEFLIEA